MIDDKLLLVSAGIAVLAASVAGCSDGSQGSELRAAIRLEGPRALVPLSRAVARDFERQNPGVEIAIGRANSAQAFRDLCAGKTDIAGASRPIRPAEADACERKGISYGEAAVANEAIVVLLNPSNPITCIRVEHLVDIWRPERPVSRWSELANTGDPLRAPISRFGPDPRSAPFEFFTETINGVAGRQTRAFTKAGEDETRTVDRVAENHGAIGYLDFASFQVGTKAVRAADVESEQSGICVSPNEFSVQDGSYSPLSRELLIYPSATALDEPAIGAFADYYVEHADETAASVGLVPLSEAQLEDSEAGLSHGGT